MSNQQPYYLCSGENCPFKQDCKRFRRDLNKVREYHFAWPPITGDHCDAFDKKSESDYLFDKIKNICGDGNKD